MVNIEEITDVIEEIKSEKPRLNYIIHVWLEGFRDLMQNIMLSKNYTNNYLIEKMKKVPKFAILKSSSYYLKYPDQMRSGEITLKQLPINKDYHLQFPLLLNHENAYEFMLTECNLCKESGKHNLPLIELRKNVKLSSLLFKTEGIMYDNIISPGYAGKKIINSAYHSINDFIKKCKIK